MGTRGPRGHSCTNGARSRRAQEVEALLACKVPIRMSGISRPESYPVGMQEALPLEGDRRSSIRAPAPTRVGELMTRR